MIRAVITSYRRSWLVAALCVGGLLGPRVARAQHDQQGGGKHQPASSQPAPENAKAANDARAHFEKGMQYFEKHAYREAIDEFNLAAEIVPSADLWFNIARAYEEIGEYQAAIDYYHRYLRDRVEPPDQKQVEQHIADLKHRVEEQRAAAARRPTTGTLRIRSEAHGAEVRVDHKAIGKAPIAIPLTLSPGSHDFDVEKKGYIPVRATVTMWPGVTTGAYADLHHATEYRSVRGRRLWTWVVGGLAVGAICAGAGLGIRALRLNNDGRMGDARRWASYSDYALGSGLGLGVVAAILYFIEGRSVGTERVQPDAP